MRRLARFNGRFTAVVCPCSRACLPPLVQPCPASWEALDVDFGGVSFPGPAPLTQPCHDAALARPPGLSHRGCRGGGGEERLRVSSSLPSPSRGVWGLHSLLQGREMVPPLPSLCVRVARDAICWKTLVAMHCTWCCLGSALVLHIRGLISGFGVGGNGSGWSLYVLAWPFGSTTLFCVLFSVCSWGGAQRKTNESRNIIPRKKNLIIWWNSDYSYGKVFLSDSYMKFLFLCFKSS